MSASIFVPEGMNLYATDQGPDNSKHLQIKTITFPTLEEATSEHRPGGGIGALSIGGLGMNALELGFELTGYDLQTARQFGINQSGAGRNPYTIYNVLHDKQAQRRFELKCIVWGRMTSFDMGALTRGDVAGQNHKITEVTRYQLFWDQQELFHYDFFASQWRVNGTDQLAEVNSILRISG